MPQQEKDRNDWPNPLLQLDTVTVGHKSWKVLHGNGHEELIQASRLDHWRTLHQSELQCTLIDHLVFFIQEDELDAWQGQGVAKTIPDSKTQMISVALE